MPDNITITIETDGRNFNLKGIPEQAFLTFVEKSKQHFPDAGEDAWASVLTDVILAMTTHESYFMTDIPKENSLALEDTLARVGWSFDQFHAYLLHAAIKPGALRIVSFHEEDVAKVQTGTLIITGLRKTTFDKLEKVTGSTTESVMGLMFTGFENGQITISPETFFAEASRSGPSANSNMPGTSNSS